MPINLLVAPIHYILDADNTGSEFSWAFEIYKRLTRAKQLNAFFVAGGTRGVNDRRVTNLRVFNVHQLDVSLKNIAVFYFKVFKVAGRIMKNYDISIIHHVLPFRIGSSFNIYAFNKKKKLVIGPIQLSLTVNDTDLDSRSARGFRQSKRNVRTELTGLTLKLFGLPLRILSTKTLKRAAVIIVINQTTKDYLVDLGVDADKIIIIPPGIDVSNFRYIPYSRKEKTTHELLVTAYLLQRKGIDLILEAMPAIIKAHKNVVLRIVGDGPQKERLQGLARDLKIEKHVIFEGFVENKRIGDYYRRAHIYLSMSRSEGFATVCLEAMASGLPIVSSRVGGFSDAIVNGITGYLVDQEDHQELSRKIIWLLNNRAQIEAQGLAARKSAENEYDWDRKIIPRYLKIYQSLL